MDCEALIGVSCCEKIIVTLKRLKPYAYCRGGGIEKRRKERKLEWAMEE